MVVWVLGERIGYADDSVISNKWQKPANQFNEIISKKGTSSHTKRQRKMKRSERNKIPTKTNVVKIFCGHSMEFLWCLSVNVPYEINCKRFHVHVVQPQFFFSLVLLHLFFCAAFNVSLTECNEKALSHLRITKPYYILY